MPRLIVLRLKTTASFDKESMRKSVVSKILVYFKMPYKISSSRFNTVRLERKCDLSRANQPGKKIFTTQHRDVVSNSEKPVQLNYSPRKRVKSHASDQESITKLKISVISKTRHCGS